MKNQIGHEGNKTRRSFIKHYYETYNSPDLPPCWMVFEELSFGTVSIICARLQLIHLKKIARVFDLHHSILKSWLHSIIYRPIIPAYGITPLLLNLQSSEKFNLTCQATIGFTRRQLWCIPFLKQFLAEPIGRLCFHGMVGRNKKEFLSRKHTLFDHSNTFKLIELALISCGNAGICRMIGAGRKTAPE